MSNLRLALNEPSETKFIEELKKRLEKEFNQRFPISWSYGYHGKSPNRWEEPDDAYDVDYQDKTVMKYDGARISLRYKGAIPYFYVYLDFSEVSPFPHLRKAARNTKAYEDDYDYGDDSGPDWNNSGEALKELRDSLLESLKDLFENDPYLTVTEEDEGEVFPPDMSILFGVTLRGKAGMFRPEEMLDIPDLRMRQDDRRILQAMTDKFSALLQRNHAWSVYNRSPGYSDPGNDLNVDACDPLFTVDVKSQRGRAIRIYSGVLDFQRSGHDRGGSILTVKSGGIVEKFPIMYSERDWVQHVTKTIIPVIRRSFPDLDLKNFKVDGFRVTFTLIGETKFKDVPNLRQKFRLASDQAWKVASEKPVRLTPKELSRADGQYTVVVRPHSSGLTMISTVKIDGNVGYPIDTNYVDDASQVPAAVKDAVRWLSKMGLDSPMSDASRERWKPHHNIPWENNRP